MLVQSHQVQNYDSNDDRPATGSQPRRDTRISVGPEIDRLRASRAARYRPHESCRPVEICPEIE
jgi:hypothetical protein